jgi:hypothetical protein
MHVTSPSSVGFVPNLQPAPEAKEGPGPDHDHDGDDKGASAASVSGALPPAGTGKSVDIKT